jgi:hypothetical protein
MQVITDGYVGAKQRGFRHQENCTDSTFSILVDKATTVVLVFDTN